MPKKYDVIDWADLIEHAQKQGFHWNYAHELVRIFQRDGKPFLLGCGDIMDLNPLDDPYIMDSMKPDFEKYDMNQMGRDIVYHFMQTYNLKEMLII
jgi:hypothetical protein